MSPLKSVVSACATSPPITPRPLVRSRRGLTRVMLYELPLSTTDDDKTSVRLVKGILANRGELGDVLL